MKKLVVLFILLLPIFCGAVELMTPSSNRSDGIMTPKIIPTKIEIKEKVIPKKVIPKEEIEIIIPNPKEATETTEDVI